MRTKQFTLPFIVGDGIGHMDGWGWTMLGVGWLAMLALVVGAVAAMVLVVRGPATRSSEAREALEYRYARGEISRDEFLRTRKDLGG
jgi:uncharacterized membrane protein